MPSRLSHSKNITRKNAHNCVSVDAVDDSYKSMYNNVLVSSGDRGLSVIQYGSRLLSAQGVSMLQ